MAEENNLHEESPHLLTKEELRKTANERTNFISGEFKEAFAFLEKYPKSITFFGGTWFTEENEYYQKARSLSNKIVKKLHYAILTGGGPGIMEAANRGAYEAGGDSLGLGIELNPIQETNQYLTDSMYFHHFFSRKTALAFSAEAYIFFPGGFGTMDEFFEIITLVQTKKIEKVPVILFCSDFWNSMDAFVKKELLLRGTIKQDDTKLYKITDDEDVVIELIKNAPVHNGIKFVHRDLEKAGILTHKANYRD